MVEISGEFTSISAGSDSMEVSAQTRAPTGARVTLEFSLTASLAPAQLVRLRYDFADDGNVRECTGIAKPLRTVARWGRGVLYYYRVSHWIDPSALMDFAATGVPPRKPSCPTPAQPLLPRGSASAPMIGSADGASAVDPFHA